MKSQIKSQSEAGRQPQAHLVNREEGGYRRLASVKGVLSQSNGSVLELCKLPQLLFLPVPGNVSLNLALKSWGKRGIFAMVFPLIKLS